MRLQIRQISILAALAVALGALAGCSYDDTAVNERIDKVENDLAELKALVNQINTDLRSLSTVVSALQNQDKIVSVTKLANGVGYTIEFSQSGIITVYNGKNGIDGTDGDNGKNGSDGKTPVISVVKDADGNYYWTVDGEYLLDADGNKIPATAQTVTPQIRIKGGNFEISYDDGQSWDVIGEAGNTGVFSSVTEGDDSVTFVLTGGTELVIPKKLGFALRVSSSTVAVSPGIESEVHYEIIEADETTVVDAFGTKGYEVMVDSYSQSEGSIFITPPDPLTDGKVFVIAVNGSGATSAQILSFEKGQMSIISQAEVVPAEGGQVSVTLRTNMEYEVEIPFDAMSWISYVDTETKAMRTDEVIFSVAANNGAARSATINIVDFNFNPIVSFEIVQKEKPADPVGGGRADLESLNGGTPIQTVGEYQTSNGWILSDGLVWNDECGPLPARTFFGNTMGAGLLGNSRNKWQGTLKSPILHDGVGTISLDYMTAYPISYADGDNSLYFSIEIKDAQGEVLRREEIKQDNAQPYVQYDTSIPLNIAGDFQVSFTNLNYKQLTAISASWSGILVLYNITWSGYQE